MKLSIVIVNYNVKHYLEQCLKTVWIATQGVDHEIFIVDNNSVDGSIQMIKEQFPQAHLIENKDNKGFAKANNQAIRLAKGEYILLLNPDTIVEHDTFHKILSFMDAHPDAGGLGVKMINGKGQFLPESKRAFPTPAVAFYKIFGLSKIFPKSTIFGKYHLGYLSKEKLHEVDVLAGAFMCVRKTVLDKIGLLDEDFFMYGEDIDLSYRIIKAGYKNYYFPDTRIIHYKGESTKKGSLNYVYMFYKAMIIFARKHFSPQKASFFSLLINIAIYLRAFVALAHRIVKNILLPLSELIIIYGGLFFIKNYWEHHVIFPEGGEYPFIFLSIVMPLYILIWMGSTYLLGGYDRPFKISNVIKGILLGTGIILVVYALLPEVYRFSRALILLGATWTIIAMVVSRLIFFLFNKKQYPIGAEQNKRFIIIGEVDEADRIADIVRKTHNNPIISGYISLNESSNKAYIGHINQLKEIIEIMPVDEIIFCAKDVSSQVIIDKMTELQNKTVDFKIAPPESLSIIGSNAISTSGDIYIIHLNAINKRANKRKKRCLDVITSICLAALLPINIFIIKNPLYLLKNIFCVLIGTKTWVGYYIKHEFELQKLPAIKKSVLNPTDAFSSKTLSCELINKLNMLYARDYKTTNDLNILLKGYRNLGRSAN